MTVALIDFGMGNRRSVEKALARVHAPPVVTADHDTLREADGLVLPGVGAFRAAMERVREAGLDEVVRERAAAGVPVIGLCLGMQLLFEHSDELGGASGLGLLSGEVRALATRGLNLPHIGWNDVVWTHPSPLTDGLPDPTAFYHVHSFVAHPADEGDVLGRSEYGSPFVSVVARGSVFGAQFHPEKSSTHGLALLRNFTRLCAPVAA